MQARNATLCAVFIPLVFATATLKAQIYQCVDPQTGNKTFSDTACPDHSLGTAIEVGPTNTSDAFASEAELAARRKQQAIESSKFRSNWEQHNQNVADEQKAEAARRRYERQQKQEDWDRRCRDVPTKGTWCKSYLKN